MESKDQAGTPDSGAVRPHPDPPPAADTTAELPARPDDATTQLPVEDATSQLPAGPPEPPAAEAPTPPDAGPPAAEAPSGGTPPPGDQPPPNQPPPPGAGPPPGAQPPGGQPPPGWIPPPRPQPLVRTREPRIIAGVCGGLARATNTDPILFRVIFAVLIFFGGIGALLYLAGWLLLPLEGESASPAEALLGRGESSTKPLVTVVLGVIAVIGLMTSFNTGPENVALLVAVVVGGALLLRRAGTLPQTRAFTPAAAGPPTGYTAPSYPASEPTYPSAAATTATLPTQGQVPPAAPYGPPSESGPYSSPAAPGQYSSPFAPHGPYAPPAPPGPPVPPAPPRQPRPPREKSILGRVTLAVLLLAMAVVTMIDVAGVDVSFTGYVATALGVTAAGLVVGAWFGRSRLLIVLGIVLTLLLGIGAASERIGNYASFDENIVWRPASVADLQSVYKHDSGEVTLDLTGLDFTEQTKNVTVRLGAGDLRVYLPPNVDVTGDVQVGVGEARILDSNSEGLGVSRTISDQGLDGAGGGTLNLTIELGAGSLEVDR